MDVLLIFVKNPIPGRVKTRLARTLGDEEAVRIYRFLLDKTLQAALEAQVSRRWVFYADGLPAEADAWAVEGFERYTQCAGDLGDRMADAFQRAFAALAKRVVIIGSDCPQLQGQHIDQAFAALNDRDVAIGPTYDGGYYLLGMRQFVPDLLSNIPWSTPEVWQQTLRIVQRQKLSYAALPALLDIDTEADWQTYLTQNKS